MHVRLVGGSKLTLGVSLSMHDCVSQQISWETNPDLVETKMEHECKYQTFHEVDRHITQNSYLADEEIVRGF